MRFAHNGQFQAVGCAAIIDISGAKVGGSLFGACLCLYFIVLGKVGGC